MGKTPVFFYHDEIFHADSMKFLDQSMGKNFKLLNVFLEKKRQHQFTFLHNYEHPIYFLKVPI